MTRINTALLSYGMSGQIFHAPFINVHPGFSLLGCWERSAKNIQQQFPQVKSYESLASVLADNQVDLVVVNTPTSTHFDYAREALLAGKHVVVEKAFTTTTNEAVELKRIAEKNGLKLAVFQNRRWDSDFCTVKEVLERGLLGDVIEANFGFLRYAPALSPKAHKEMPSAGAGILKDLGPHVIDQANCLFGMPNSVFADIAVTRPGSQVDDYFSLWLYYGQCRVLLKGGYFFREPGASYILHGTKGSFSKSRADVQEDQLKAGIKPDAPDYGIEPESEQGLLHTELNGSIIRENIPTSPGNYMQYYEGAYQSIVHDQCAPVSAQDGINVMRIIDAALESAKSGRRIDIC